MKDWHEIDGWFNDNDALVYKAMVDNIDGKGDILEIGAYKGRSTVCLAQTIQKQGKPIGIHVVDTFKGDAHIGEADTYDEFMGNMLPYANMVATIRKGESVRLAEFNKCFFDGVYIDASHDYWSVVSDIKAWLPYVKIGGIMGGHDYNFPQVHRAVHENFTEVVVLGNSWLVLL